MSAPAADSGAVSDKPRAVDTNERTEKENGSDFQQQRLTHFYAQHNPPSTIICMFIVAIIFIPIGSAIIAASESLYDRNIRYDHINSYKYSSCNQQLLNFTLSDGSSVTAGCRARPTFTVATKIEGPVYMYYRLVNFYQNYRLYAKSLNDNQLQGVYESDRSNLEDCWPFSGPGESDGTSDRKLTPVAGSAETTYAAMQYAPCGAVPWSMFNDTIALYKIDNESVITGLAPSLDISTLVGAGAELICDGGGFSRVNNTYIGSKTTPAGSKCTKKGIAFEADTETRFKSVSKKNDVWHGEGQSASTDRYQRAGWYANEVGHSIPLTTDEDFMVWTRIAGLADFRKLYRRIDGGLEAGTYALDVVESFDVASFGGQKYVVLQTDTWVGGRNFVLGALFIMFGGVSFVLAIAFLIWYVVNGPTRRTENARPGTR